MFARLDAFLRDPLVTDVLISSNAGLWVDRGVGLEQDIQWNAGEEQVRRLATELIARGGRHIDMAHPCVDVRLDGGIRVHAVLSPVATGGTTIAVRIPRSQRLPWEQLISENYLTPLQHRCLLDAVDRKMTVLITGASGAGKTALLGKFMSEVKHSERIVVLEDVAELQIAHPHVISLEAQQANGEGAGGISLEDLVPQALRMRADRLVLGECRGAEFAAVISALNTGHSGGLTLHANSLQEVPARLLALGFHAGMSTELTRALVVNAIDLVVHVERGEHGRRIAQMGTFVPGAATLQIQPLEHTAGE